MNITQQNIDDLTATITLTVAKEDYAEKVETVLNTQRKSAAIPGFRKGKVPMGMIRKQYGMAVQMEEINKIVSQELQKHLNEADFKILGEPLPSEKQTTLDFDNGETFDFLFDIGISPKSNITLTDKDSVVFYDINVEADAIDKQIAQYKSQFAEMTNPEVVEAGDMLRGDVAQVDAEGNVVEGGITKDAAVLTPDRLTDDAVKALFIGAKVGTSVVFSPSAAMTPEEALAFVGLEPSDVVEGDFKITVTEIVRYIDAEVNEDMFKKAYPNQDIATEEDFLKQIESDLKKSLVNEASARFEWDAREYVVAQMQDVAFPEAFLKRWITVSNADKEDFDAAKLDAEFPKVLDDIRWQLATASIVESAELKIEAEDPLNTAKKMAAQQFAMYGMANLPEEYYEDYAKKLLEDQSQMESIIQRTMTDKVIVYIKDTVKLDSKAISMDDFKKLYEQA